jgi:NAD(P)-dependent dehydrogenase (short-subunit alcohol dehydrogenase family)
MDLFDLTGKKALVTGGTRGIGMMIARGLLDAGASVVISSRGAEACEKAVAELSSHGTVSAVPADLQTEEECIRLADAVDELDILVNNAGATWGAPLEEFPQSGWDRVIGTNLEGVFNLTVALLPALRAAATPEDPARVINIGSIDGLRPAGMENYSYSASKAAVHMLTRHLAKRLASEQITVNAIAPGPFESKMTAFMFDSDEGRGAVESMVPLGRIGRPDDAAGLVQFLCSRAGSYLTGTIIPLDGGITGC